MYKYSCKKICSIGRVLSSKHSIDIFLYAIIIMATCHFINSHFIYRHLVYNESLWQLVILSIVISSTDILSAMFSPLQQLINCHFINSFVFVTFEMRTVIQSKNVFIQLMLTHTIRLSFILKWKRGARGQDSRETERERAGENECR